MFLVALRMHVAHGTFNLVRTPFTTCTPLQTHNNITRNELQWYRQIFANISETKRNRRSYV